jgi:hypothetical protein
MPVVTYGHMRGYDEGISPRRAELCTLLEGKTACRADLCKLHRITRVCACKTKYIRLI